MKKHNLVPRLLKTIMKVKTSLIMQETRLYCAFIAKHKFIVLGFFGMKLII